MASSVRRDELAALPLLDGAAGAQLDALAECLLERQAQPGEVLGRQGAEGDVFWLILDGIVAVTADTPAGVVRLAEAGRGSIIGELAVLRGRPRTATVTATTACRYLCGGHDAMDRLLAIDPVRLRVRRLVSRRLAEDARPVKVCLRSGSEVLIRPLLPSDRAALDSALHRLSRESIRKRFFSAGAPSTRLVDYLIDIDYVDHFAWVALDVVSQEGIAVGRYIRQPGTLSAEVALTTIDSMQGKGIGTVLLGALGVAAREAGLAELVAYVMEDNHPMRTVFAKADGHTRYDEPGLVHVTMAPDRAAALLDPGEERAMASSVHDVVTAASLALA